MQCYHVADRHHQALLMIACHLQSFHALLRKHSTDAANQKAYHGHTVLHCGPGLRQPSDTGAAGAVQAEASNSGHAEASGSGKAAQDKSKSQHMGSLASLDMGVAPQVMLCYNSETLASWQGVYCVLPVLNWQALLCASQAYCCVFRRESLCAADSVSWPCAILEDECRLSGCKL